MKILNFLTGFYPAAANAWRHFRRSAPVRVGVLLVTLTLSIGASRGQTMADNFTGSVLNTSNWTASGIAGSSVTVNNGLFLKDRGRVTSVIQFTQPLLTITGSVSFNSSDDFLSIAFRSDGTYGGSGQSNNGLIVDLQFNAVTLKGAATSNLNIAAAPYSLVTGQSYDFKITDDGSTVSVFLGDLNTPLFLATSSISAGGYVGFYNREFTGNDNIATLNSLSISAVPEPSTFATLVGAAALVLAIWHRKRVASLGA